MKGWGEAGIRSPHNPIVVDLERDFAFSAFLSVFGAILLLF